MLICTPIYVFICMLIWPYSLLLFISYYLLQHLVLVAARAPTAPPCGPVPLTQRKTSSPTTTIGCGNKGGSGKAIWLFHQGGQWMVDGIWWVAHMVVIVAWYDMTWHDMTTWHDMIWHDDMTWYHCINMWCSWTCYEIVSFGLVQRHNIIWRDCIGPTSFNITLLSSNTYIEVVASSYIAEGLL